MRGRKPIPSHLQLVRGNPGKRPLKPEPQPAIPESLPEPPDFLSLVAAKEWRRIVPELSRLNLLTVLDINPLAVYCEAYAHWVEAELALAEMADGDPDGGLVVKGSTGSPIANPLIKVARCAAADVVRYASEFGFTPAARTRIGAVAPLTPSKFHGLFGMRTE
jgi:P27 family predicted phage terminase small subunit